MFTKFIAPNSQFVLVPNRAFGDSDAYTIPKLFQVNQDNYKARVRQAFWKGTQTFDFIINIFKCHSTHNSFDQVVAFFITYAGQPIIMQIIDSDQIKRTQTGFIKVTDGAEMFYNHNLGLQLITII